MALELLGKVFISELDSDGNTEELKHQTPNNLRVYSNSRDKIQFKIMYLQLYNLIQFILQKYTLTRDCTPSKHLLLDLDHSFTTLTNRKRKQATNGRQ